MTPRAQGQQAPLVDREECMGFGYCVETLPAVFSIDDEGRAVVSDAPADAADLEEVVDGCPRGAISLDERVGS